MIILHDSNAEHQLATEAAEHFLKMHKEGAGSVKASITRAYQEKVERNRRTLVSILDVILALGQRGLPLRGNWDRDQQREDGNFHFFINWKSSFDPDLQHHMKTAPGNAKYLSPQIQNELIECTGQVIRKLFKN